MANLCESLNNSPTNTEPLHPGYPFREYTNNDDDLPEQHYPRPYLASKVNLTTGDPCVIGKEHITSTWYDKGPLEAQPMTTIEDDFEDQVGCYPFRENAYLDPNFLQALGKLDDQGIAAKGLRMIQLEEEGRALKQWEKRLTYRENQLHQERVDLICIKDQLNKKQKEVFECLQHAKAASRLIPQLPKREGQLIITFPRPTTQPYYMPNPYEQRTVSCYWCGRNGLDNH